MKREQEATERIHAEKLAFVKEQIMLDLEYQNELSKTKQDTAELSKIHAGGVKMPKIVISKFTGTPEDWVRRWISWFNHNFSNPFTKIQGPFTTQEILGQELFLVWRAQKRGESDIKFLEDKVQLNLKHNSDWIIVYQRRIQGQYPIYIPDSTVFAVI